MNRPFFSIVVPCYNDGRYAPGQYIDRLLTSITNQGLDKDDLEVIISDDHSKIPYKRTLNRYKDRLNIQYVETDYNFAPGNTRQKGSEVATGQWLCFADHDDIFCDGALTAVKEEIEKSGEKYIVYTDFDKVDPENFNKIIETFRESKLGTWIHGKFYNLDNFWKAYNLHFIKDLRTHEDIALGREVECVLHHINRNPHYFSHVTYNWIWNRDSVSHGTYIDKVDKDGIVHPFMERNFNDFLVSQIDVLLDQHKADYITQDEARALCLAALGNAYMSVCTFKANNPEHYLQTIEIYSSRVLHRIEDELELSLTMIKVMLKSIYTSVLDNANSIANQCHQIDFISWLENIQNIDYKPVVDAEVAELTRKIAKKTTPRRKSTVDKNHRPFFSIVIACYNDGRYKEGVYLDRLLSSIARQDMPKEDLEVILSDDCSPEPFDHIIAKHESEMIIKYIKTDYNFAPGNTRAKGVTIATGEWLCFADHDDIFYDGGLRSIYNAILEKNEQHFAFGDFYGVTPEGQIVRKYEAHLNWCHGKFYNKDNLWDKYGIHFIHDLKSHEDIAICTQVSCVLASNVENYTYLHKPVYAWTDNPQSVSHAKYTVDTETGPREFLEVFFEDYVTATGYVYFDYFKDHLIKMEYAIKCCLEITCYCYFYLQGFQFRRPDDFYKKNLDVAGEFVSRCKKTFNMTNQSMYNAIASNKAYMYYDVRRLADPGSGRYIPTQTLKQWLELVSPDIPKEE